MAYVNRSYPINIYCPAIEKYVRVEVFSHHNEINIFASHGCSHQCLENHCPFQPCKCLYDNGKLILRD